MEFSFQVLLLIIVSAAALVAIHRKMFDWAPDSWSQCTEYAYIIAGLIAGYLTPFQTKPPIRQYGHGGRAAGFPLAAFSVAFRAVDPIRLVSSDKRYMRFDFKCSPDDIHQPRTGALCCWSGFASHLSDRPASKVIRRPCATGLIIGLLLGLIVALLSPSLTQFYEWRVAARQPG